MKAPLFFEHSSPQPSLGKNFAIKCREFHEIYLFVDRSNPRDDGAKSYLLFKGAADQLSYGKNDRLGTIIPSRLPRRLTRDMCGCAEGVSAVAWPEVPFRHNHTRITQCRRQFCPFAFYFGLWRQGRHSEYVDEKGTSVLDNPRDSEKVHIWGKIFHGTVKAEM